MSGPSISIILAQMGHKMIAMSAAKDIWVVIEHAEGVVKPVSFEAIHAGRLLSAQSGGQVKALFLCSSRVEAIATVARSGVDQVVLMIDPELESYTSSRYLAAIVGFLDHSIPGAVLLPATNHGKELAPALAASLGSGLATDCIGLDYEQASGITIHRPIYGGKAISSLQFSGSDPVVITLRPNVFRSTSISNDKIAPIIDFSPDWTGSSGFLQLREFVKGSGALDITEARIVVSGGLGMQGPENFSLLEDLASAVGGAVGASRPVVDNGWRDYSSQVGQTGRTVAPDLYIACGISGAVQHLAGMSSSKRVVAINKDANAPIFDVADYGIVGDALEILPILTREFKSALPR